VPAGRYSSTISQADANAQAQADVAANAQANANNPPNAVCIVNTAPDWETPETPVFYCQGSNEVVQETDMNPNSPTYGQVIWGNVGAGNGACPTTTCGFIWGASIASTISYTITSDGTTATYRFVFSPSTNSFMQGTIGQITGGGVPSANRTVYVTDGINPARTWQVTFTTQGLVQIALYSGPAANSTPIPAIILSGTYQL
jgi:hypothetical protein